MKYIIANWKMNLNVKDLRNWATTFNKSISKVEKKSQISGKKIVLAPSFPYISIVKDLVDRKVDIAAQDVSIHENGAYTGFTGAFQIKDFCKIAIVGHSERKEPADLVLKKRDICLKFGITPIVCFGKPKDALKFHKKGALIAWEDPENISKGGKYRASDPTNIAKTIASIKNIVPESKLIYGGSVNRKNIEELTQINGLAGVLIGNASNDPKHFVDIINKS